jgi:ribosomal protein S18 acetylase RimI-like enzyme
MLGVHAFRPVLSLIAADRASAMIAGFLIAEDRTVGTGIKEVHFTMIGTRPGWRHRGIGSALISASAATAQRFGYQRASLRVDADNATGAVGLYERAGFLRARRRVSYVLPLLR